MRMRTWLVLLVVAAAGARADEVICTDGRVYEGVVTQDGDRLEIETPFGRFVVPCSQVEKWSKGPPAITEYARRRDELSDDDAAGLYQLGRWCELRGLIPQSREEFARALAADPEHEGARQALGWRRVDGKWVPPKALLEAAGFVRYGDEWLLPGEAELRDDPARLELDEALVTLLRNLSSPDREAARRAREVLAESSPARLKPVLGRALRDPRWDLRAGAAWALGAMGDAQALPLLVVTALTDRVAEVRKAAVDGLRAGKHPDAYVPFVRSLAADEAAIRVRAVQALAELRDPRAVEYIVKYIQYAGGGGPRTHLYVGRQIAYVADFDVEVAQRAAIADPIIRTIQDGLVLDVRTVGIHGNQVIIEQRIGSSALQTLTGANPGDQPTDWIRWWREHRHEYEDLDQH